MAYNEETKQVAVAAYLAGESSVAIGARLDLHRSNVLRWVREAGHKIRRTRIINNDDVDQAAQLYASGETLKSIAKRLDVSVTTVVRLLDSNGVNRRKRGGGRKRTPWKVTYQIPSGTRVTSGYRNSSVAMRDMAKQTADGCVVVEVKQP